MRGLSWNQWPLAVKLSVTMTTLVIVIVAFITLISVAREQENFKKELQQQAALQLDTLTAAGSEMLYKLDAGSLQSIMTGIGDDPDVSAGSFFDSQGRVLADARDTNA